MQHILKYNIVTKHYTNKLFMDILFSIQCAKNLKSNLTKVIKVRAF